MKKYNKTYGIVIYTLVILTAVCGLLCFLLAPAVSIRPKAFGIRESEDVSKVSYSIWDVWNKTKAVSDKLDEMLPEERLEELDGKMQFLLNFIPDKAAKGYELAYRMVKLWPKLRVGGLVIFVAVIVCFLLAVLFGLFGLLDIRKKWNTPKIISVSGSLHIIGSFAVYCVLVKIISEVLDYLEELAPEDLLELGGIVAEQLSITGDIHGVLLRCVGWGLIASWVCAFLLIILGLIAPKRRKGTQPEIAAPDDRASQAEPFESNLPMQPIQQNKRNNAEVEIDAGFNPIGRIVFLTGEYQGYEIDVHTEETVCVGSDPAQSQIIMSNPDIMGCHCIITGHAIVQDGIRNVWYEVRSCMMDGMYYRDGRALPFNEFVAVKPGTILYFSDGINSIRLT